MTLKINGANFGNGEITVKVHGEDCSDCCANHGKITCGMCPGGPALIATELVIIVDSLASDPFNFYYKGLATILFGSPFSFPFFRHSCSSE